MTQHRKEVRLGLGTAVRRLMQLEWQIRLSGRATPPSIQEERNLLLDALDHIPIEIGIHCDEEGEVPLNVDFFETAVTTSCCRLLPEPSEPSDGAGAAVPKRSLVDRLLRG